MSDLVISFVRTIVPMVVGALVAWLTDKNIEISPEAAAGVTTFLTTIVSALYYAVARILESKLDPRFGWLLGATKTPKY